MTSKEISVFIIGLMLVGFLYYLKNDSSSQRPDITLIPEKTIGIDQFENNKHSDFDPTITDPVFDKIMNIPALKFNLETIQAFTSDELVKSIQLAIDQDRLFQPYNDNALFYLVTLKSVDENNPTIKELTQTLTNQLESISEIAITENNDSDLKDAISKIKTLNDQHIKIDAYEKQLASITTINKIYDKGIQLINDNLIVTEDSNDAWHTAKQILSVDAKNSKSQQLVNKVNEILINNALRAAEEVDFQLAQDQIDQAKLLDPESVIVNYSQNQIDQLKQQRYVWLEQQISTAISRANATRAQRMLIQMSELGLPRSQLSEYNNEIARIKLYGKNQPFDTFNDKTKTNMDLPTMVIMPTGRFIMGSDGEQKSQQPVHSVTINYGFAVSQNEISVAQFKAFIESTGYQTDADIKNSSRIYDLNTGRIKNKNRINWEKDYLGKKSEDENPVIHVSWNDANAYTKWLNQQTGKSYRLLSESEFEYVLRAGSNTYFPWGNDTPIQVTENLTGKLDKFKSFSRIRWKKGFDKYNDKFWGPAPIGSFTSNPFKLNDMAGNVMEWVTDCWHSSYVRAPTDGSAWSNPGCERHVIRGGSWSSATKEYSSSHRYTAASNFTDARLGFRVAMDLVPK